jgi:hypothetical protein
VANYGQNHSIVAAFGAQDNFAGNLFGGNSVSGLINLGRMVFGSATPTTSSIASTVLKGGTQGIPGLSGAVGQARGAASQFAVGAGYNAIAGVGQETLELGITASGQIATSAAQLSAETLGNVAFGVGVAKFAFDFYTVSYGYLFSCK